MTYHPHLHCIVPAGGLTKKGQWVHAKSKGQFLFPVKAVSRVFKGKLMATIHSSFKNGDLSLTPSLASKYYNTKDTLYRKEWVVYTKKSFGGPKQVLEYLGRYSHRICISNHRILHITNTHVTFSYLDRKANTIKSKTIAGTDFIRLFTEHILPKRFVKIRHFGILSSRSKKRDLALCRLSLGAPCPPARPKLTTRDFIIMTTGKDPYKCPCCSTGEMVIVALIPPIRGSPIKPPLRCLPTFRKISIVI